MAQIPYEYGGYILILIKSILYIFDKDKNKKLEKNLAIINGQEFNIIPYTFDNPILNFFISYKNSTTNSYFIIQNITYYLAGDILEKSESHIEVKYSQSINHVSCLLLNPSSLSINYELLTCFGAISNQIFSITLNPKESFNKEESLTDFNSSLDWGNVPVCIVKSLPNKNKEKAFIYVLGQTSWGFNPYIATFDYINKLSSFENIDKDNSLSQSYYKNKVFYFSQTEEFVVVSGFNDEGCKKFVMVFHNDCKIYYKGIIKFDQICYNTNSFIVFFNGFNYTILIDSSNNNGKSFINFSSEL